MYTDWIGWRGRRGDELPAAGGAARFKPDQGVEARPLRATNAITNRKLEMVFECARASCGIVRHAALSHPTHARHTRRRGLPYSPCASCRRPAARARPVPGRAGVATRGRTACQRLRALRGPRAAADAPRTWRTRSVVARAPGSAAACGNAICKEKSEKMCYLIEQGHIRRTAVSAAR